MPRLEPLSRVLGTQRAPSSRQVGVHIHLGAQYYPSAQYYFRGR